MNHNLFFSNKKFIVFICLLVILTIVMIFSFMPLDKINPGHDILFHYRRINALMESLKLGTFPIYIDYEAFNNYGYGARWFYSDLLLIPFALLANVTSFVFAYKSMWFVMTILCGLLTYKTVNTIYKNSTAAAFASLLYTFSAYRLQDIFERGAVGEALAITFIPIVFWGLYEIIKGDYKKWYIISIGYALLIYTHLLSSVLMFITTIIILCIYYKDLLKQPKRFYYLLLAGIITIILSSYFLLPFIEQMINANFQVSTMMYKAGSELSLNETLRSIIYPHTIFSKEEFEPYIGVLLIACLFLRFFIKDKSKYIKSIDIGVAIGIIYILLSTALFSWSNYPLKLINFIQFPWRLYEFSTFFFAVAGGYYLSKILKQNKKSIIASIFIVGLIGGLIITNAARYKVIRYYYTAMNTKPVMTMDNYFWFFVSLEYFPENLTIDIIWKKDQNIDSNNVKISNIERTNNKIICDVVTNETDYIELPLTYYKGYSATLNEQNVVVKESKQGLVEVKINESGKLIVSFTGTFIQKYSIYITLISFALLIIYIYMYNRKRKNKIYA